MGVVIRQGSKASIIALLGTGLGYLNWFYFFPRWVSTEEIGLFKTIFDAAVLFSPFLLGGTAELVIKFSPYFTRSKKSEGGLMGYVILLPIVISLLFICLFWIFKDQINTLFEDKSAMLTKYIWYIVPMSIFYAGILLQEALTKVRLRIVVPKLIREVLWRILNALAVLLYFLNFISLEQTVVLFICSLLAQNILLLVYYWKLAKGIAKPNLSVFKSRYRKLFFDYSFFMVTGNGSTMLAARLDVIMTSALMGLNYSGIYGISFLIAQIVELPRRTFNSIIAPLVSQSIKAKKMNEVEDYYKKSALNLFILGTFIFLGIWSNLDLVYSFTGDNASEFSTGEMVILLIGLSRLINLGTGVNGPIIANSKYYRWNIYITPLFVVFTVVTNLIFIPLYGITGAALATFFTVALNNLTRFMLIKIKLGLSPFTYGQLKSLVLGALVFALTEYISINNIWLDAAVNTTLILTFYLLPIVLLKISSDLNNTLNNLGKRFLKIGS